ncbi:MAG: DUF6400 family protein [Actinomycetota bacterium]|nr:DUF6400 family protein [Actinomycetota bacterium]
MAELTPFVLDLAVEEGRRLSAVLEAGTGWNPLAVLAGEAEAHGLLYSGLDLDQQRTYHLLVREGILDV